MALIPPKLCMHCELRQMYVESGAEVVGLAVVVGCGGFGSQPRMHCSRGTPGCPCGAKTHCELLHEKSCASVSEWQGGAKGGDAACLALTNARGGAFGGSDALARRRRDAGLVLAEKGWG